jgi:hypothetical protein
MTWGTVFNRYVSRGHDHSSAAFQADQWEKRQHQRRWSECPSTHCERRQECASPHECCANLKNLRALSERKKDEGNE